MRLTGFLHCTTRRRAPRRLPLLGLLCLALGFASCESIFDENPDCRLGIALKFVYDYHMEPGADAFASNVDCVSVLVFDAGGNYLTQFTETSDILREADYRMELPLDPGDYHLVVYGGLACADASFTISPDWAAATRAVKDEIRVTLPLDERGVSDKQLHDIEMKNQEERYERQIQILRNRLLEQQIKAAEEQRRAVEDVRNIYQAKIDLLDPKAREQNNEQDKIIFEAGLEKQTDNSQLWQSVDQLSFNGSDYTNSSSDPKFSETISEAQKELEELRTIAGRFRTIPLENSIKDYVPAIMHQSYRIANSLAENAAKMQNDLAAFHTIAERSLLNNADGIILSTENAPVFSVYIANMSRARIEGKESVPAQILNGNRQAATGILSIQDGYFIVTQEIDENTPPAKIYNPNPGDRIRIIP